METDTTGNYGFRLGRWALILVVAACGDVGDFEPIKPPPPPFMNPPPASAENIQTLIQEDFDNRRLLETEIGNPIVDVNQGIVSLTSITIPQLVGSGLESYDGRVESGGLVEAESIIVLDDGLMLASDSVELRAVNQVRISGTIRVGRGGVTIVAGESIAVTGTIESEGPVQLIVADESGLIEINGQIITRASLDQEKQADISLLGRGRVVIGGELTTIASESSQGGNIIINVYNDVTLNGFGARVAATAKMKGEGLAGAVQVKSESKVYLLEGAKLGNGPIDPVTDLERALGGDIDVQGSSIEIDSLSHIIAGGAAGPWGGSVILSASGHLRTEPGTIIRAGAGPVGGSVLIKTGETSLGATSVVEGGLGVTQAGLVLLEAVDQITLAEGAQLNGGLGECTVGGDLSIRVGGLLSAGPGTRIAAGVGTLSGSEQCGRMHPPGVLRIDAREAMGLQQALVQGPNTGVLVNIDPELVVNAPNLTNRTSGSIESKTFDRGPDAVGDPIELVDVLLERPDNTDITLGISASMTPDGPFDLWFELEPKVYLDLGLLSEARYFKYRVNLNGRTFDAPVLDYFVIDLAPLKNSR